jgi:threonine efflux protein
VAVVVASALCWYALLAYLLSRGRIRAAYSSTHRITSRVASIIFGALGLGLLVAAIRDALSRASARPET